jgi:hypothetical protein
MKEATPPPNTDPKKVLIATTARASFGPNKMIVTREIALARPSFIPGTGIGTGIILSIIWSINACETRTPSNTIFFVLLILLSYPKHFA